MFYGYEVADICGGKLYGNMHAYSFNISTDSRIIEEKDLFVALSGDNFDGNNFASTAFDKGATICVVSREVATPEGKCVIVVNDTGMALLQLASYYRAKFNIPVVGITGSVGKTTTKELIASGLASKLNVLKTSGNFNNEIGVPKTLFRLNHCHQVAVIEMGMNAPGEISRLSKTAKPNIALITNIGLTHIENLGSIKNILKAKLEILDGLSENGTVVLNADDPYLAKISNLPFKTVFFGIDSSCEFCGEIINDTTVRYNNIDIVLPLEGKHNLLNAMAAVAVGSLLGIDEKEIANGINKNYEFDGIRQTNIIHGDGYTLICDFYNASPSAVAASLEVLGRKKGRKVAVLGDMLELGYYSEESHKEIGLLAAKNGIDIVFGYGKESLATVEGARQAGISISEHFDSKDKLVSELKKILKAGDFVLIKGSRGMKMEEIYEKIMG